MQSSRSRLVPLLLVATTLALAVAAPADATVWSVPGDNSNTCTVAVPSCNTLAGAVAAASNADEIQIAAGSFAHPALALTKTLTITGAGIASTTLQLAGGVIGFNINTSGIVIQDLKIQGGATGIRFAATSTGTDVNRVEFSGQTSRGIDITTGPGVPINDIAIADCIFATASTSGIRMSSNTNVTGLAITGSAFTSNSIGIYQANDGNTSKLAGLAVSDCVFTGNSFAAIYVEEIRDSSIEDSTFTGNGRGLLLYKAYTGSGTPVSNLAIRRNQFSGNTSSAMQLLSPGAALGGPLDVEENVINQDVGVLAGTVAAIEISLGSAFSHAPVNVTDNSITLSGTFGAASAAHAIGIRGNGPVVISGNRLDGGGVGAVSSTPPSSGVYIRSVDASYGQMPASATVSGSCNRITGFVNGVSVFDSVGSAYGGLLGGTAVTFDSNAIEGNDSAGIVTAAAPPTISAENNFWGCPAGPGNAGCDDVVGDVDATPPAATLPACVACVADSDCSDGLSCNGSETCNIGTGACVAGTPLDCSAFADQCNTAVCLEPTGCAAAPVADDTVCSAAPDVCSLPDTCQTGTCEDGGGGDSGDGICTADDNCPSDPNPGQEDVDNDGIGDVCDGLDAGGWSLRNATIAKAPKVATDKWSAKGELSTTLEEDFLPDADASGVSFAISSTMPPTLLDTEVFSGADCVRTGKNLTSMRCKNANGSTVRLSKRSASYFWRVVLSVRRRTLPALPTLPNELQVTVHGPNAIDRADLVNSCRVAGRRMICKEVP